MVSTWRPSSAPEGRRRGHMRQITCENHNHEERMRILRRIRTLTRASQQASFQLRA